MSETLESMTIAARRTASNSVTMFKNAARFARTATPSSEPVYEMASAPTPPEAAPSVISAKAVVVGSITTPEELHIEGAIEGDVRASRIVVRTGGSVKGTLAAEFIVIHGAVDGKVDGQHVLLCGGAVVTGEITHCSLGIDTTAIFEGSIKRVPMPVAAEATAAE